MVVRSAASGIDDLQRGDFGKLLCSGDLGGFASSRNLKNFMY
jgi:hypothetical protein